MIAQLTGTILEVRPAAVVLDVTGVGYLVFVRAGVGFALGERVTLYTHLAVRENSHDLYGFTDSAEREMFELLIKLPKIGPKSALQILTQADRNLLVKAISDQDPLYLTKMSGLGKKTAEKIVSELKDSFFTGTLHETNESGGDADVVDALIALGYTQKDARDALLKLPADLTDTHDRIKAALKLVR